MILYEAYNSAITVQFIDETTANNYATENNLSVRQVEILDSPVIKSDLTKQDWLNLEQALYVNENIFGKALNSTGNGFAFLSKVFADGKTTYASENALLNSINFLMPSMIIPYTQEEIDFINLKFQENNFSITI